MKKFITYLPLTILFIIGITFSFAQQNQTTSTSGPEVESLKKRISELEIKLQNVENIEKMELAAKLADANAQLANAEFGKFERELRDSNDQWLRNWSLLLLAVLSIFGVGLWSLFKSKVDQLIADTVESSLNGFKEAVAQVNTLKNELKEAVGQVNILQDQIRILEKEHAVSVLVHSVNIFYHSETHSEQIKPIPDRALLDLLADKTRDLGFRYKAMEILVIRESIAVVSPGLELLNSVVDSDFDWEDGWLPEYHLSSLVNFLGYIHAQEVYEGLKKILDRLLSTEDQKLKSVLLASTVFSLARVSGELNTEGSVSLLKTAIPYLNVGSDEGQALKNLAEHFHRFNETQGIKDILTNGLTDEIPEVETKCLGLLQKHHPDFVNEWRSQKETGNTENEESS